MEFKSIVLFRDGWAFHFDGQAFSVRDALKADLGDVLVMTAFGFLW